MNALMLIFFALTLGCVGLRRWAPASLSPRRRLGLGLGCAASFLGLIVTALLSLSADENLDAASCEASHNALRLADHAGAVKALAAGTGKLRPLILVLSPELVAGLSAAEFETCLRRDLGDAAQLRFVVIPSNPVKPKSADPEEIQELIDGQILSRATLRQFRAQLTGVDAAYSLLRPLPGEENALATFSLQAGSEPEALPCRFAIYLDVAGSYQSLLSHELVTFLVVARHDAAAEECQLLRPDAAKRE